MTLTTEHNQGDPVVYLKMDCHGIRIAYGNINGVYSNNGDIYYSILQNMEQAVPEGAVAKNKEELKIKIDKLFNQ